MVVTICTALLDLPSQDQSGSEIPILIYTSADTAEEELVREESRSNLDRYWEMRGYGTVYSELPSGADDQMIRNEALNLLVPLILISDFNINEEVLRIESRLIHTVDGALIGTTQSAGDESLGASGKWSFVVRNLADKADAYPLIYPEKIPEEEINGEAPADPEEADSPEEPVKEPAAATADEESPGTDQDTREDESIDAAETNEPWFVFDSIDVSSSTFIPLARFREYSKAGTGAELAASMKLFSLPLDFRIALGAAWAQSESDYVDTLFQFTALIQLGYTIPSKGIFSFGFRGSAGMIGHLASGNLNTLEEVDTLFYADQYYGIEPVFRIRPGNKEGEPWRFSFFLAPGFYIFPNEEYWGFQITANLGASLHF